MENYKPFIYPFKTSNNYYVYDVNTNRIIKLNQEVYNILDDVYNSKVEINDVKDNKIIMQIINNGMLSSHRLSEIIHPEDEFLEYHINNLKSITIQVTQQCNLRCHYCPYSGGYVNRKHNNNKITFDIVKKGIDFYIEHSVESKDIVVGFYGGEPLLEFNLIKESIEYIKKVGEGKKKILNITTNGTLITKEIIEYFKENNVNLTISLDGPKSIHDKNRNLCNDKGSFDIVIKNVEMIKQNFPDYFKKLIFNSVLDLDNNFKCIDNFFTSFESVKDSRVLYSFVNLNYAKDERGTYSKEFLEQYNYEIFKLFLNKLGRLNDENVSMIVISHYKNIENTLSNERIIDKPKEKGHPGGPCIPGCSKLFMNIYGNFYPCESCSEESEVMNFGNIYDGFNIDKCRDILNIGKLTESKCKNCWAYRYCYLCAAKADNLTELSASVKIKNCEGVEQNTSNLLKDYCTLRELGDSFESLPIVEFN